mgnify:CR=1 FL=1
MHLELHPFFSEYNMLSYSALVYAGNRKYRTNRYVTLLYVLAYMVYYWISYYVITGTHATSHICLPKSDVERK